MDTERKRVVNGCEQNGIERPLKRPRHGAETTEGRANGVVPTKEETLAKRKRFIAPSQKLFFAHDPLKIVRGEGQYLFDETGKKYLDCINNVCHVGHCHKRVVDAGSRQMAELNTNSRYLHDAMCDYAEHLASKFPGDLSCCFFTNSGSEANDLALRIADVVTGKNMHIAIDVAYHGHLKSVLQLSTYKRAGIGEHVLVAPLPDVYNGEHRDTATAGQLYADDVKALIDGATSRGQGVSCFIMESLFSCAGQVIPPKGYLEAVYKYVHAAGGVCIADEVQVGFGRVGEHFWAFELQGVVPDIVTIGKPMGNGHPVAAVITTQEIARRFESCIASSYFNTYGGNPVSMAVAHEVLRVIEDEGLQEHARTLGHSLIQKLRQLQAKFPSCIGLVRGVGMFIGLVIVKDPNSREPHPELAANVINRMLCEHQVLMSVDGIDNNVIKFKPPLCFNEKDANYLVTCLEKTFSYLQAPAASQSAE